MRSSKKVELRILDTVWILTFFYLSSPSQPRSILISILLNYYSSLFTTIIKGKPKTRSCDAYYETSHSFQLSVHYSSQHRFTLHHLLISTPCPSFQHFFILYNLIINPNLANVKAFTCRRGSTQLTTPRLSIFSQRGWTE